MRWGNGDGWIGDDRLVVSGFLGQRGRVRLVEAVFGEGGRFFRDGGTEVLVEKLGLGNEVGVAEALPGGEGKVDLGGVCLPPLENTGQETRVRRHGSGDRGQETGVRRQGAGVRGQAAGDDRATWRPDRSIWRPDRAIWRPDRSIWRPDRAI